MAEARDTPGASDERADRPKQRRRLWIAVGLAAAAAAIALIAVPVVSTLQPGYYERYPDLGPRMENWRTSTHALVGCAECHVEPGFAGHIAFAAESIPAFYSQLVSGPSSTNLLQVPGADACQTCHTSFREVSSSGDLLIPHRAHVEVLEIDCAVCHVGLVHADNDAGRNTPRMTLCLDECHDGEQASAECLDCHTRKQVPDSHLAEDWLQVHAERIDTQDCGECHAWSPDYCADCHADRPPSHVGNWKNDHQFPALERGEEGCMTCHDDEFCKECHD